MQKLKKKFFVIFLYNTEYKVYTKCQGSASLLSVFLLKDWFTLGPEIG